MAGDYKARGLRMEESGVDLAGESKVDVHGEGNRVRCYLTHDCGHTLDGIAQCDAPHQHLVFYFYFPSKSWLDMTGFRGVCVVILVIVTCEGSLCKYTH